LPALPHPHRGLPQAIRKMTYLSLSFAPGFPPRILFKEYPGHCHGCGKMDFEAELSTFGA